MIVLINIMYDGSNYCGWQIQPNRNSIQGEITKAVKNLTGEQVNIIGSGRTDAGVHALGQTASFELNKPFDINKILKGLNFYLPKDIRIIKAKIINKKTFNARKNAKKKTYIYRMYMADIDNPLLINRALRIDKGLDIKLMKEATKKFIGTFDFSALMSSGSEVKSTVRTVLSCSLTKKNNELCFTITANGFLYNMVRKIVALILSVGKKKRELDEIDSILSPPFNKVKEIAPPYALYLLNVVY